MKVYKITNTINGKFYIGVTTQDLKARLRGHRNKANPHLLNAFKKYGNDAFVIEQIDSADTLEELSEKEIYYINKMKPQYNKTSGGEVFNHIDETKRKIGKNTSEVRKTKSWIGHNMSHTEETKQKISNGLKGNSNKLGKTGYTLSDEFKEKRRQIMTKDNPSKRDDVRQKLKEKALSRPKFACSKCGKMVTKANLSRWHNDNCKVL